MTSIAFASLFFGLITGPYPISLEVHGAVAVVEIRVDGRAVGAISGPPWKTTIDFGSELEPHEVFVRALDSKGTEVGHAQEFVNLPHTLAKVEITLEAGENGSPRAAQVEWSNLRGDKPTAIALTLDGAAIALDAHYRAALPLGDSRTVHLLSALVEFSPALSVREDAVYGGSYGAEVATALTAVPLKMAKGSAPLPGSLAGQLTAEGRDLTVAAVEDGPAQLFVVRSPNAAETTLLLGSRRRGRLGDLRFLGLDEGDEVRFLFPFARRYQAGSEASDLFDISPAWRAHQGALPMLINHVTLRAPNTAGKRRIADAVGVAGLEAVRENRRRAVLLVLSGREDDESQYDPTAVRHLLSVLHVPLFVWFFETPRRGSRNALWGGENASDNPTLVLGVGAIRTELKSQKIVLVNGRHLPQTIRISPGVKDLRLAGDSSP